MTNSFDIVRQNIKLLIKEKKISQSDIANQLNLTTTYINFMLNGKRYFSERILCEIAKILDISVHELFIDKETSTYIDKEVETTKFIKRVFPEIIREKDIIKLTNLIISMEVPIIRYNHFAKHKFIKEEFAELIEEYWEEKN